MNNQSREVISGLALHCHHHILVEWVTDYNERVEYIKERKPKDEQELRLRLFKMIPLDRVPQEIIDAWEACNKVGEACDKAGEAYDKAREACDKAGEAYGKAWEACNKVGEAYNKAKIAYDKAKIACDKAGEACDKAGEACGKAWEAYGKAGEACDKAREACLKAVEAQESYFNDLHKELCPDCPWDGKSIFHREVK